MWNLIVVAETVATVIQATFPLVNVPVLTVGHHRAVGGEIGLDGSRRAKVVARREWKWQGVSTGGKGGVCGGGRGA